MKTEQHFRIGLEILFLLIRNLDIFGKHFYYVYRADNNQRQLVFV